MAWVLVEFDPEQPQPKPEAANFFHFTQVQDQVEMLVGYLSLAQIHQANERVDTLGGNRATVRPEVTHRFLLSIQGMNLLKERLDQLLEIVAKKAADRAPASSQEAEE